MKDRATTACAPGKIVLSGEHSVVYGGPALALAVNRFATTTITQQSGYGIWFEFLNNKSKHVATLRELQDLKKLILKRYRKFLVGKFKIKDVVHGPLELIQYAFIYLVENMLLPIKTGLKIQVDLTVPIGCGMGASSAVILSLMHALLNYCDQDIASDKYLYFGREIENLQHGRSSGLDLFLSLYGGCHFFVNGDASRRNLVNLPFILVNTGRSSSSTGECVEKVAKFMQDNTIVDSFSEVTVAMDKALSNGNSDLFKEAIQENNELLCDIGVVPKKVSNFIDEVARYGNVAKISGAGAVIGESAGIVLVVGENDITGLVKKYGYEVLSVRGEKGGLRLI